MAFSLNSTRSISMPPKPAGLRYLAWYQLATTKPPMALRRSLSIGVSQELLPAPPFILIQDLSHQPRRPHNLHKTQRTYRYGVLSMLVRYHMHQLVWLTVPFKEHLFTLRLQIPMLTSELTPKTLQP